jgi:hypothetical protein
MAKVHCIAQGCNECLIDGDSLEESIQETLRTWNEDDTPQCFIITDDKNNPLVTLLRNAEDHELAHVLHVNGTMMTFRCHYILDANGHYERTEVTRL